jgi:hypothetical protein
VSNNVNRLVQNKPIGVKECKPHKNRWLGRAHRRSAAAVTLRPVNATEFAEFEIITGLHLTEELNLRLKIGVVMQLVDLYHLVTRRIERRSKPNGQSFQWVSLKNRS